jgi:hypothetical protein
MSAHAVLSPSGAHRWLSCTRSARLEQQFPDSAGQAAAEGTLAHSLGELITKFKLKKISKQVYQRELKKIESDKLFDQSMMDHAESYSVFVLERYYEAQSHTKDAVIYLEQLLNLTEYVQDGFGTGDSVIIADGTMEIVDLKYGKGVLVTATNNKQMMLYALGALKDFDFIYDIEKVRMTIFQPRIDNFSTWEISVEDLLSWAELDLKPKAALAFNGEGEFSPGTHCQFCKAKAVCKANADYNLQLAVYDFAVPELMTDEEIADILERAPLFTKWLKGVLDHALSESINNGKKWPGWKLVEGKSNRTYSDEGLVATKLFESGFAKEIIYKDPELHGITEMTKRLGKKTFETLLSGLVIKPQGKPTLAPLSDKREELNSLDAAAKDFAEDLVESEI